MNHLFKIEVLTLFIFTILAIINGQVTVFYIVYLFWFQELMRSIIDLIFIYKEKKTKNDKILLIKSAFGSFFILYVYVIFIVVLFGLMLNWGDEKLMYQNISVILFKNWYFNFNIIAFVAQYAYYRNHAENSTLELRIFNRRHIILHLSVIIGGLIQMSIVPRLNLDNSWNAAIVIIPFLLLKVLLDKPKSA
jgi:hypothetical protein